VLNTETAGLKKVMDNKELSDLITALGCGIGPAFDLSKLRYQRVVLLADADSDGHHITTLLLTFFYRHLPGVPESKKVEVTRFKGLGEMMPKTLWETTLDPATRRMLRVEINDQLETDRVMSDLMGKDPSARFRFIMERAEDAEEVDV